MMFLFCQQIQSEEEFNKGRLLFLEELKSPLYHLDFFRNRYEEHSRKNIFGSIEKIRQAIAKEEFRERTFGKFPKIER